MSEEPFYVVETSGYRIGPGGRQSSGGIEHELHVVGPNGVHVWRHTVSRGIGALHLPGYQGGVRYPEVLAHYRAEATAVCREANERGTLQSPGGRDTGAAA